MSANQTDPSMPSPDEPMEEEMYSAWALLILMTLLIGALWASYHLQLRKIRAIHETVISIMAGKRMVDKKEVADLSFGFS
jgi:sodium/hydrogen exchanger-like protein 6/7